MDKGIFNVTSAIALNRYLGNKPDFSHNIIDFLGSAEAFFELSPKERKELVRPFSELGPLGDDRVLEDAEREWKRLDAMGYRFLDIFNPLYPPLLKECPDAPLLLYVRSSSALEEVFAPRRRIAVVGTRDCDSYGKEWCAKIVRCLSGLGEQPSIVSGLAIGVDIHAHLAALDAGASTIAVSPVGIDEVYPRHHRDAAARIAAYPGSAVITDYPPGTVPYPGNFLRRNRIIAGISDATILIQSRVRGGGMMTARLADGYGRPVFALPGRIDDSLSAGCNLLTAEKIAEPLVSLQALAAQLFPGSREERGKSLDQALREKFGQDSDRLEKYSGLCRLIRANRGADSDSLHEMSGLPFREVEIMLASLENEGIISRDLIGRCCINAKID